MCSNNIPSHESSLRNSLENPLSQKSYSDYPLTYDNSDVNHDMKMLVNTINVLKSENDRLRTTATKLSHSTSSIRNNSAEINSRKSKSRGRSKASPKVAYKNELLELLNKIENLERSNDEYKITYT